MFFILPNSKNTKSFGVVNVRSYSLTIRNRKSRKKPYNPGILQGLYRLIRMIGLHRLWYLRFYNKKRRFSYPLDGAAFRFADNRPINMGFTDA